MNHPNVLLIMLDQLRFDALGYSSKGKIETPAIDYLASLGTVFNNAYTPAPSCIPARACLMTGQKPWKTGVLFTGNSAGPYKPGGVIGTNFDYTLPGQLVKEGYHAEGVGKMHFFPQRSLLGFSHILLDESGREEDYRFISDYKEWFLKNNPSHHGITDHGINWNSNIARPFHADEAYHPSVWTANETLTYLEKKDPSIPFFIKMSFARPHSPYDPSQYFFDLYEKRTDLPEPYSGLWDERYENKSDCSLTPWCGKKSDEIIHIARAGYYGSITQIDYQIGKVLLTLQKAKLLDEMLIIFTSDHGDMLGDHNLWRKTSPYEGSAHIPLIVKLPKSLANEKQVKETEVPVSLIDILPTVFDICKITIPSECDGQSLKNLCINKNSFFTRKYVSSTHINCYDKSNDFYMVTDGNWKYSYYFRTGREELFDISNNKTESINLSYSELQKVEELKSEVVKELSTWNTEDIKFVVDGKLQIVGDCTILSPNYEKRLKSSNYKWL